MANSLLNVEDASKKLGISTSTLYKLIDIHNDEDWKLKSVTIGKSRLIPEDSIDEFIQFLKEKGGVEC